MINNAARSQRTFSFIFATQNFLQLILHSVFDGVRFANNLQLIRNQRLVKRFRLQRLTQTLGKTTQAACRDLETGMKEPN